MNGGASPVLKIPQMRTSWRGVSILILFVVWGVYVKPYFHNETLPKGGVSIFGTVTNRSLQFCVYLACTAGAE
jgi:hypothetical protein